MSNLSANGQPSVALSSDSATPPIRALGYTRVSKTEQARDGFSLARQTHEIEAHCSRKGWMLAEILEDGGYSGGNMNRPAFQRARTMLENGEVDALIVTKVDRFSRSIFDFVTTMSEAKREGWKLVSLDMGIDLETPQGRAFANVLATFAELERELIGQRIRDALAEKRERGDHVGRRSGVTDETRTYIRALRDSGLSWRAVADTLNAEGVPTGQPRTASSGKKEARWWAQTARRLVA